MCKRDQVTGLPISWDLGLLWLQDTLKMQVSEQVVCIIYTQTQVSVLSDGQYITLVNNLYSEHSVSVHVEIMKQRGCLLEVTQGIHISYNHLTVLYETISKCNELSYTYIISLRQKFINSILIYMCDLLLYPLALKADQQQI